MEWRIWPFSSKHREKCSTSAGASYFQGNLRVQENAFSIHITKFYFTIDIYAPYKGFLIVLNLYILGLKIIFNFTFKYI